MINLNKQTTKEMIYNKITLAFPGENEIMFRKQYFSDSIIQLRVAFVLIIILYGLFGYLDLQMFPEYANLFHIIRYLIVIPIFTIVLLLSFTKLFQKVWQELLVISFIVSGSGISIMTMLTPENYAYYAGMMLIFSAGYFFIKLRFFLATIAGWSTLLVFNIGAIFYAHSPSILLINNNFFFISANLIGMFAAYNIEYHARRNFFLNQKLDIEKLSVEELNKNLEKIIGERTKELRKAKEKAEESDRLKSAFLANMSHEIRTPMNGILGFSSLLQESHLSGENQQKYIQIIEKSGTRMLNIINNIVDVSKIEAGLMKIDIKDTNINEQIEYIYTFFKPEVESKGLKFSFKNTLSSKEAIIKTDTEKVFAILTNLVKNALKYTDKGSIEFGYEIVGVKPSLALQFYVKDTGIGIPKKRQEAIFKRFIQANYDDNMARQGAGLGLTITKSYVEMLGGNIWLESKLGFGSSFYFTLPYNTPNEIIRGQNDDQTKITDKLINSEVSGLKVLIVEDDETSTSLMTVLLKNLSREIIKTITGFEAVEACRNNPDIDLILMDIQMPDLNGYDATRQIRQFNKDVIIIAQTAFGLSGDKEKAIEAGCNDYISKPIKKEKLLALIQTYFKK